MVREISTRPWPMAVSTSLRVSKRSLLQVHIQPCLLPGSFRALLPGLPALLTLLSTRAAIGGRFLWRIMMPKSRVDNAEEFCDSVSRTMVMWHLTHPYPWIRLGTPVGHLVCFSM